MLEAIDALIFIEVDDGFTIGVAFEGMSFCLKTFSDSFKIIDLAIKNQPYGLVFIAHGLMASTG
jgi:hypothetical protein